MNINKDNAFKILYEYLNMKQVYAKIVQRILIPEKNEFCKEICSDIFRN